MLTVGDKYGYDYLYVNHKGVAWVQPKFQYGKLDFFLAAKFTANSFWRNGLFQNGEFPTSSYGKSSIENFLNYAFKGGLSYNFDAHNSLYANGAYLTKAPNITDAFLSPETRNQLIGNVPSEQVYSAEGGYQYKSAIIKARATFYCTQINNQVHNIVFYDDQLQNDVNFALSGIDSRNIGGEAVIEANLYRGFSAQAIASVGRRIYTDRAIATVTDNSSATLLATNETIYQKGYNLGGGPEMAYSFGLSYHSPQYWFVDLYFNYYDWQYVEANPARLTAMLWQRLHPAALPGMLLSPSKNCPPLLPWTFLPAIHGLSITSLKISKSTNTTWFSASMWQTLPITRTLSLTRTSSKALTFRAIAQAAIQQNIPICTAPITYSQ